MHAITRWGGGLCAVLLFSSVSFAQGYYWATPVFKTPYPTAPDACGPGYYVANQCGAVYGPNYWLLPPFPPYNGPAPPPGCGNRGPTGPNAPPGGPPGMGAGCPLPGRPPYGVYPTHPYVRGPRDFFMWNEDMDDTRGRDVRPPLVVP